MWGSMSLIGNVHTWASCLSCTDISATLLQSHALGVLSHVSRIPDPAHQMCWGTAKGAGPAMFVAASKTHPF
jgi:hypothetical protein